MKYKQQDANKPDYKSGQYLEMLSGWVITNDLWGGTLGIRKKERKYLPQFPKEPSAKYKERLQSSVFYNVFQRTVSSLVGLVFKNATLPQDVPNRIEEMFTDIDLCGNDIEMFLRESFTNAVRDGHSFIFVDAPPKLETEDRTTLADVADRRPFWINYTASQAVNWQYEIINGKTVLTQITFHTVTMEKSGTFGEKAVERYKVLRRGDQNGTYENFIVNDKKEVVSDGKGELEASWSEIPVAVVYGRKIAPLQSQPPLLELAHLNILHYQKTSDYDDICHRICVPILKRKLDSQEDLKALVEIEKSITISPAVMMNVFGQHSDIGFVEVSGSGLQIVEKRIDKLEAQMSKLGLELLAPTDSETTKTATEIRSDNSQSQSDLAVMAKNLETATEQALYFTAEMINAIFGSKTVDLTDAENNKFKLKIDYEKLTFSVEQLQFFGGLVETGKLSLKTFLEWLPQITEMPKNFNPDTEVKQIADEKRMMQPQQ